MILPDLLNLFKNALTTTNKTIYQLRYSINSQPLVPDSRGSSHYTIRFLLRCNSIDRSRIADPRRHT